MLYLLVIFIQLVYSIDETGECGEGSYYYKSEIKQLQLSGTTSASCTIFQNSDIETVLLYDLQTIGNSLFSGCTSLRSVKISTYYLQEIGESAFAGCTSLTKISGPVKKICSYAFQGCTSLTEVSFQWVIEYGDYVFDGCLNLESVVFDLDLEKLGSHLFNNCPKVIVTYSDSLDKLTKIGSHLFTNNNMITEFTIPNHVTEVGRPLFSDCPNLEHVILPVSASTGTGDFFSNCPKLKELTFNGRSDLEIEEQVIGSFEGLSSLEKINIMTRKGTFGPKAFKNCINLKSVNYDLDQYPLWHFGESSFYGCENLESIVVNEVIDDYAFYKCTRLTNVQQTGGLIQGGKYIFGECLSLQNLDLIFHELGDYAFYKCTFSEFNIPSTGKFGHYIFF